MNLKGKVALITGSARRVGKAIALALAEEGANIVIHYGRSHQDAQATQAEIEALGVETLVHSANLADPAQITGLFEAIKARFGRLDVLVNSAASFVKEDFDAITVESWDSVMALNLRAPFLSSQHAARLMRQAERESPGLIVNILDLTSHYAWQGFVQHGVSKAGLRHLTQITARELAPDIRANALTLGPILPPPGMPADSPEWQATYGSIPLKRPADVREVGQAVVSLALNDFITGAELHIDGGEHLLGPVNH